ncbi:MAG: acetolactate synthase large subunit, partial [Candidatus Omnitrophica bacterium]|nr:acetolactate synthase large subunit [Candidatus Omnitrophota bacterium]
MSKNGAEIITHLLERQGIEIVAGIPGGANLPLYDALSQSTKIRHVLARHEQGAGFMAQGMARVTGTPQVCLATSGPGATNILTAIADAKMDSIPVICITGQVPSSMIGTDAFQEVDTYGMSIPITKHNFLVRSAAELFEVIPAAFRIASSGRPGPVLVDVPKDVQMEVVEFEAWPEPGKATPPPPYLEESVARAAEFINKAKRPVLYMGGGFMHSNAGKLAVQLAEQASLPTTMTLMGL